MERLVLGLLVNIILAVIVVILMNKINKRDRKDTYPTYQKILAVILTIIITQIGIFFLISLSVKLILAKGGRQPLSKKRENDENDADTMVECASCKTFVSVGNAIKKGERYFCCTECLKVDGCGLPSIPFGTSR
jgi:preprotein translocase subunit SecG